MKWLLLPLIICVSAQAQLAVGPYTGVANDPCLEVIKRAVGPIEYSTNYLNKIQNVSLLSASEERSYELKFYGLAGHYELILDNDGTNKCFLIQQKYVF